MPGVPLASRAVLLLIALLLSTSSTIRAQVTVRGRVSDASTHETLPGVRIEVPELHRGAISDINGDYAIPNLPEGTFDIQVKLLGYETATRKVTLRAADPNVRLDFALKSAAIQSGEVIVQSDREREIERQSVSRITLSPNLINAVPAVGGERDLFRVLQLLPGIKSLSEVSSGLYIRGGAPDQNLILLDNNPIYNPTHLFGFFSTFNTDAIKDVDLSKGGFPAQYGGRLTGVLNVTTREGSRDGLHGKTSVSLISARQTLEFPLLAGSALVSARRTYVDAFLDLTNAEKLLGDTEKLPRYYFYDLNAKIDQDLGPHDKLSLTGYYGSDNLTLPSNGVADFGLSWGNQMAGADWTHIFSEELFSKVFLGYTGYSSNSEGRLNSNPFQFENGIREFGLKTDVDWQPHPLHQLRLGGGISQYRFTYYNVLGSTNQPLKDTGGVPFYISAYAQDEWKPTDKFSTTYGVRAELLDVAQAVTIDPRISVAYQLSPKWSLKAATGIYHQFLHLVSIGEFTFFDLWVPGTSPLPPSTSTQYILGLSGYPDDQYFASVELYYKRLANIVEYNETKFLTNDITLLFPRGQGEAYGAEFFLQKRIGKLTGWLGYTLSWVHEQLDSLNEGLWFSPKYDQRHDVQLVLDYKFSDTWRAGATWTYATGQAYTSTLGFYTMGFDEIDASRDLEIPGLYGRQRLPAYHRADASVTYSFSMFGHPADASLQIFNLYSHRNVWFRVVNTKERPAVVSDIKLLPIIPTLGIEVSY